MSMLMFVPLREVKPDANCHQHASDQKLCRYGLIQQQESKEYANKWRNSEISSSPRGAKVAQFFRDSAR